MTKEGTLVQDTCAGNCFLVGCIWEPRTMKVPLKRTTRFIPMLALLALAGCGKGTAPEPPTPEVTVAKVISRRIQDWDEFTGRFQAIDTVELRPRASGYIDQVLFHEGQLVKKDDVLV